MNKLLHLALFIPSIAFATEQCYDSAVVNNVVHIMLTQTATINQKQAEIDALKKFIAESGLVYETGLQRFINQLKEHGIEIPSTGTAVPNPQ